MKKLMLTTAIASVFVTSAMAQTTITGEARFNYKTISAPKGAGANAVYTTAAGTANAALAVGNTYPSTAPTQSTVAGSALAGTADTMYGFGAEQQINIQTKGKLNLAYL